MAKSGLPFIRSGRLRAVARSSGFSSPVEVEASKCKIDTILCNLEEADSAKVLNSMASSGCRERTLRCLPLLDDAQGPMKRFSVRPLRVDRGDQNAMKRLQKLDQLVFSLAVKPSSQLLQFAPEVETCSRQTVNAPR